MGLDKMWIIAPDHKWLKITYFHVFFSWKECACQSRIENEIDDREAISSGFLVKKKGCLRLRLKFKVDINENIHINIS